MTISEVISFLSLVVSIVALYKSSRATNMTNSLQASSNDIQMASIELSIRMMVEGAKKEMDNVAIELSNSPSNEVLNSRFLAAKEKYANAYDEACTKYLDNKIDRIRFMKTYSGEIRNLVNSPEFKALYQEPQTKYHATVKVYKEWNDYEQ